MSATTEPLAGAGSAGPRARRRPDGIGRAAALPADHFARTVREPLAGHPRSILRQRSA